MGNNCTIKSRPCTFYKCTFPIFAGGFCKYHQSCRPDFKGTANGAVRNYSSSNERPKKVPAKTSIKRESKSRAVVNRLYSKQAKEFRQQNPLCALKIAGVCTKHTQGVHHTRGKATIELLLKQEWWMPACNPCNNWCESHAAEAKEMGFKLADYSSKLSRFKK